MRSRRIVLCILAAIVAAQTVFAQSQFKFKELVQAGDDAPVPPQLSSVLEFSFSDQAQVALIADGGIILKSGNSVIPIAGPGDTAPGGGVFFSFTGPSLGPQGQVAFSAGATFPSASAAYLYANGNITQFMPNGIQANTGELVIPAVAKFARNGDMLITDSGSFFTAATYLLSNNMLTRVVGPGDLMPDGSIISFLQGADLNSSKQVVFSVVLTDGRQGLFLWSAGTITKIIANGDTLPDGVSFAFFDGFSINDPGQVVFGGISNSIADSGILSYFQGQLSVVIPRLAPLPDGSLLSFPFAPSLNNAGQITFPAFTTHANDVGIFLYSNGQITTLELPGQTAPDGGVFRFGGAAGSIINGSGQVLFIASESQHGSALYLFSGNQSSRVIGQGDTIPRQPHFVFPAARAIAAGDTVLIGDSTFPGGAGAYTATAAHGTAPGRANLVVHAGEPIGVDGIVDFLFGFNMNHAGLVVASTASSEANGTLLLNDKSSLQVVADSSPESAIDPNGDVAAINSLGEIAFNGFDPASHTSGTFLNSGGQTRLLLSSATPLPGGGTISGNITNLALNSLDQLAFMAQPFPGPAGVFTATNGIVTPLAVDGAAAPGGGNFLLFFGLARPVINDNGDIAFSSLLTGTSGGFFGSSGVFLYKDGALSRIVGPGDPSPDGGTFLFADSPSINSSGDIAFFAETSAFSFGAFVFSHGQFNQVAVAGDFINNVGLGFVDQPVINNNGHIAFTASLFNGQNAIFLAASQTDHSPALSDWVIPTHGVAPAPERMKEFRAKNNQTQSLKPSNKPGQSVRIIHP
jgi:hypothetical protein